MPFDSVYPTFFKVSADGVPKKDWIAVGMRLRSKEIERELRRATCLLRKLAEAGSGCSPPVSDGSPEFARMLALSSGEHLLHRRTGPTANPHQKNDNKNRLAAWQVHFYRSIRSSRSVICCFLPKLPAKRQATNQLCSAARGQPKPKPVHRQPLPPRCRQL